MFYVSLRMTTVVLLLTSILCAEVAPPAKADGNKTALEGLWSGSWGGGEQREGVVFQPVLAELAVQGDKIEVFGFREVGRLSGTVRVDATTRRLRLTPKTLDQSTLKPPEYTYELKGNRLTLIDSDKIPIHLERVRTDPNPIANASLELVSADGINDARELQVTMFNSLRAGRPSAIHYQPDNRLLKTTNATVLEVQEAGVKKVTVDEARRLIRKSTPVAITYRNEDDPPPSQNHELWTDLGSPQPDSEVVWKTYSRTLRPGTLIFVLPAREKIPQP